MPKFIIGNLHFSDSAISKQNNVDSQPHMESLKSPDLKLIIIA